MRALVAILTSFLLLAASPVSVGAQTLHGLHCDLTQPPEAAGELPVSLQDFGTFARAYPRVTEILAGYSGCQAIWAESSGLGGKPYFLLIDRGEVVDTWPKSPQRLCQKGEDTRTGCRDPLMALMPTYPAGCLQQAKALGHLSTECVAAFASESQALQAKRLGRMIKNAL